MARPKRKTPARTLHVYDLGEGTRGQDLHAVLLRLAPKFGGITATIRAALEALEEGPARRREKSVDKAGGP